ncbi:ion transporter [Simiduia agarivorans]|uniref:Potassium channel n=1 Tax=Simiduia agarivorans (strain DSM 21679 / JCM 13881 / BCRC 17597 / SA1) TaxID=1117647 RepID=K4KRJ4_SIMAS|nr:ion transporter [Simiduia agarivorans]AFV00916.1 potassium channel [Simiduia agarivorans SA1 = DSM 21679]
MEPQNNNSFKFRMAQIIFGYETPAGRAFDIALIWLILASVLVMMIDSVNGLDAQLRWALKAAEWAFTLIFTVEYGLRIYVAPNRWAYVRSFYGLVDLLSILPTYLGLFFGDLNYLLTIRLLRVLRIFRILKLARYLSEANVLMRSMIMARRKILVFFSSVLVLTTIFGSLMYVVEGPENGFTSIPKSIYWAIVSITTVGYGDITPHTNMGQLLAALVMLTGYSIIAIPTGIFTAELVQEVNRARSSRLCGDCNRPGHESDARYCRFCGHSLSDTAAEDTAPDASAQKNTDGH